MLSLWSSQAPYSSHQTTASENTARSSTIVRVRPLEFAVPMLNIGQILEKICVV